MTVLQSPINYNVEKMVFSDPQTVNIPDSDMSFKRINIQTMNKDGSQGDLVFSTSRMFSFGVSEETSRETGKVSGYKMPLCCWNIDGASKDEKKFTTILEEIAEKCKDHLLDNKEEIEKYELERSDLKKIFSAVYWKMDKGKRIEGQGPTLYTKLVHYRKDNKFGTVFFNPISGVEINPLDLIGKRCDVKAAVKIDNIYIGGQFIRIQINVLEAAVEERSTGGEQLLARPSVSKLLSVTNDDTTAGMMGMTEDDDAGSLASSSDEEEEEKPKEVKKVKKKVKKIVKRKIAKR
jgi:hypothetical protein